MEARVGLFLPGCKCPVSRGIIVKEQDNFGEFPVAFFLQNIFQLHKQIWAIFRVDNLALWKIINAEVDVLIPKKTEARNFQRIFAIEFFSGGLNSYAATPLNAALSPGHSDITRFRPGSPIATRSHLDRAEKFPNLLRRLAPLTFLIRFQAFRDPLRLELPHVQIWMNDGPNPLTWDAHFLSCWFSRNPAVFQD